MRIVQWTLAVSAALFVSGIAFIIAAARSAPAAPPAAVVVETTPVASVRQIMRGITGPAATVIYSAVGTSITLKGVVETEPKNDEEWANVANNAAALAESGNLLMLGDRAVDKGDWIKMSRDLVTTATAAVKAANEKNKEGILDAGSEINNTCDNCHAKYQRQ